ncbi:hypothetical protein [Dyadobacter arcticus]|uniref:Erythromycin esterase homolog n=1 Tax=Dyadobacter arcticus TaxID=1078754 RepID=A0ABX0UNV4_9BACT|nr:hypothetical protein [Dyadobacter arcticus]NIJ53365.1 hypothetical protein [Dyadobacter arcticus]
MKKITWLLVVLNLCSIATYSQDTIITVLSKNHMKTFLPERNTFVGTGWLDILEKVKKSNYVLIGEDHLMNEVPQFCSALLNETKFDNFFCEIDPFSASIIETRLKSQSDKEWNEFILAYGNTFSFYAMKPELDLFKQLVKDKTKIFGTDQILIVADRLICNEWKTKTKNAAAAAIYAEIENQSKTHFDRFRKDPSQPFYMLTSDFEKNISALSALQLSKEEVNVIDKLKLTARIYKEQNHHLRIQLMKEQLMQEYENWADKKSLFKYGAIHMPKGQSLMDIYDLGNLINNVADSRFQKSLHIMIIGKSGSQASPFEGFPASPIDQESDDLKTLKPFFKIESGENWQCFDLGSMNVEMKKAKINPQSTRMSQILEGYDLLVIIPTATPAKFAF